MEKEEGIKNAKDLVSQYVKHKDDMSSDDRELAERVIKAAGVDPCVIGGETMEIKEIEKKSSKDLFSQIKSWFSGSKV
jgi:hypothetical protein